MKQEMLSYLHTIKDDIFNLSKFLYENPEESFYEYKAYNYIIDILKNNSFKVTEEYLDIPTAFYAEYGSGHPKVCYICEYDAATQEGHITGHNLISAMSIGAALSLASVLDNFKTGTVIILGCPGEFISGSKVTMVKQGTFKDIDVVLMAHPDIESAETGTSMALLPIDIKFKSKEPLAKSQDGVYSSLDGCNFILSALSLLKGGFKKDCNIDNIKVSNTEASHLIPTQSELKFYIRAPKMTEACEIEKKVKELVSTTSSIMELSREFSMSELPYYELIPNHTLSRIFAHNLKEIGIIDTASPKNSYSGLSIGTVSHVVPCIHPYISITEDSTVKYNTIDFARATTSDFAKDKVLKISSALAMTGLDLLEKEDLIQEIKTEFFLNIKNHIGIDNNLL